MAENSGFDIIIPYHGQYTLVRELIGSICLYTRNIPYRITIVDDASPNKDFFTSLAQLSHIDGARHETQKGFGAALNTGIKLTKRPWILGIHSDCLVNEVGWLNEMWKTMNTLKESRVRLVSARSDNPGNPLLQSPKNREDIQDIVSDSPLPLFCFLLSRKMYTEVGPFKEYPYAWYEDEEYFWRMKKFGYRQAVSGSAWVKHEGEATIKELWTRDPGIKEAMENNRNLCIADIKKVIKK